MVKIRKQYSQTESGRSMVEMLGTLAIMGVVLIGGLMIARPAMAFDEGKCTEDIGTAFTAGNGERFCLSKIQLPNWFTAFSWCEAIGGHLATFAEACNGQRSSCNNIKGAGRSGNAWTATPCSTDRAWRIDLSAGNANCLWPRSTSNYYALCK